MKVRVAIVQQGPVFSLILLNGASITFPFLVAPASIVPSTKRKGFRDSSHPRAQVAKRKLSVMPRDAFRNADTTRK